MSFSLFPFLNPVSVSNTVGSGSLVHGTQQRIPKGKERLRKVGLDAPRLVVDVMVCGVIVGDELKRIPWESVATVIINRLDTRERKEQGALANSHACQFEGYAGAEGVEQETLERVVV